MEKDVRVEITRRQPSSFAFWEEEIVGNLDLLFDNWWHWQKLVRHRRPCFADWQVLCSSVTPSQTRLDHFTLKWWPQFYCIVPPYIELSINSTPDSTKTKHYFSVDQSCLLSLFLNSDLLMTWLGAGDAIASKNIGLSFLGLTVPEKFKSINANEC